MKPLFKLVLLAALGFGWALPAQAQNECGLNGTPVRGTNGTDSFGINHQNMCVDLVTGNIFWPRTIQGTIALNSTANSTACRWLDWFVAGSICYPTIQPAVNAAAVVPGGPGCTIIPGTYTGTDSFYADTNCIIDLRHGSFATGHYNGASYPSCQDSACTQIFHWGGDYVIDRLGPSDLVLSQNTRNPGAGQVNDTATNLVIGVNSNVPVTNQTGVALDTIGQGISFLVVGRGTANEEVVTTYTINSPTSITLTCAKTHTAPVSIEQVDAVRVDVSRFLMWRSFAPPVSPGFTANMNFVDTNGSTLYELPGAVNNAWPNNALNIGVMPISAWNGPRNTSPAMDVIFRNSSASTGVRFQRSTDGQTQVLINDTVIATANGFNIQEGASTHSMAAGGQYLSTEGSNPGTQAGADVLGASSSSHCYMGSFNGDGPFCLARVITGTSTAFATATTAGTCVQNVTAVTGATTSMTATASPVSTPGVGAVWSAFVSSAGNVTINECAVATSAGGTIAFNIRVLP